MSFENATIFPASRLTCERCSGHGYVETALGCLACLECSAAASSWIPASQPPKFGSNPSGKPYIDCIGVVAIDDCGGRLAEIVAYWPAKKVWTQTALSSGEWDDVKVTPSHYFVIPELPPEVAINSQEMAGEEKCL